MDSTIIAGIIGGICTLLSAFLAFILTRRQADIETRRQAEHDKPPISEIKRQQVTGQWEGTASIESIPGSSIEYTVTAQITASTRMIQAIATTHGFLDDRTEVSDNLDIFGTMIYEHYLKLEFRVRDNPEAIQFGYLLLKLYPNGKELKGKFVSYSPHFDRIIHGSANLHRKLSTSQLSSL